MFLIHFVFFRLAVWSCSIFLHKPYFSSVYLSIIFVPYHPHSWGTKPWIETSRLRVLRLNYHRSTNPLIPHITKLSVHSFLDAPVKEDLLIFFSPHITESWNNSIYLEGSGLCGPCKEPVYLLLIFSDSVQLFNSSTTPLPANSSSLSAHILPKGQCHCPLPQPWGSNWSLLAAWDWDGGILHQDSLGVEASNVPRSMLPPRKETMSYGASPPSWVYVSRMFLVLSVYTRYFYILFLPIVWTRLHLLLPDQVVFSRHPSQFIYTDLPFNPDL